MIATVFVIIALCGIFILEAVLTEVESFGWATITLLATGATVHFTHIINLIELIRNHAGETFLFIGAYLVVGIIWSFIKWFSFLMAFRNKYREAKESWLALKGLPFNLVLTADQQEAFFKAIAYDTYRGNRMTFKPKATTNKGRIVAWMSFWPFSAIGTIINDPVRRFFSFLFNQFKATYQRMSDRVMASHSELK
jgi:hypothetical protein